VSILSSHFDGWGYNPGMDTIPEHPTVVLISADAEWRAVCKLLPSPRRVESPFGEYFLTRFDTQPYLFFQGGWGKISAAASTQYVIDRWRPKLLVNLGTCGGFEGHIERGQILLVEKTIVYDLIEQMGDPQHVIEHYTTEIDLSWLGEPYPLAVRRSLLVSGDRDLLAADIPELVDHYGAVAGDWESAAIAWTAQRNRTPVLILRGVTDLVGSSGGEAYGNLGLFEAAAAEVLERLITTLPGWRIAL
jgi:adenosylhomocysteine nucleosidase